MTRLLPAAGSVELQEICAVFVDVRHRAPPVGHQHPQSPARHLDVDRLQLDELNRVSWEARRAWKEKAVPQSGDLVVAREVASGEVKIVPRASASCAGQSAVVIRPDRRRVDAAYLRYLLRGRMLRGTFEAGPQDVRVEDVRSIVIPPLPPIDVQRAVASIVQTLEDLIENNDRQSAKLDGLSRALASVKQAGWMLEPVAADRAELLVRNSRLAANRDLLLRELFVDRTGPVGRPAERNRSAGGEAEICGRGAPPRFAEPVVESCRAK